MNKSKNGCIGSREASDGLGEQEPEWITVCEAHRVIGRGVRTIRKWIAGGELQTCKSKEGLTLVSQKEVVKLDRAKRELRSVKSSVPEQVPASNTAIRIERPDPVALKEGNLVNALMEGTVELPNCKDLTDDELASAINGRLQTIQAAIHTARQHASAALVGALQTGAYLDEVHNRLGRTGWGQWMKDNCPDLPISTAYRYKSLFKKFPHVRTQGLAGLRQSYIAVGLLPEAPPTARTTAKRGQPPTLCGTDLMTRVKADREFFGAELRKFDYAPLDEPVRKFLIEEVTALIATLNEVRSRIENADALADGTQGAARN